MWLIWYRVARGICRGSLPARCFVGFLDLALFKVPGSLESYTSARLEFTRAGTGNTDVYATSADAALLFADLVVDDGNVAGL